MLFSSSRRVLKVGNEFHRSTAEFKGQGREWITGTNGSLSSQVNASDAAPLLDLDIVDTAIGSDLEADYGTNGILKRTQRGFEPVLSDPLLNLTNVPGVHGPFARSRADGDTLSSSEAPT